MQNHFHIHLGSDPSQHSITFNDQPFGGVFSLEVDFEPVEPEVTMRCRLPDALQLNSELAVTYIGPADKADHNDLGLYRVHLKYESNGESLRRCEIDGELFPHTGFKVNADAIDPPVVRIWHYHRPFPAAGSEPEICLLRGRLVPPLK